MKHGFLLSACAVALLAAAPAVALAQATGKNTSTIAQDGSAETVTVSQNGQNDSSTVSQTGSTSDHNTATVTQTGISGGSSTVTQSGSHNVATVTTADDGSVLPGATLPITVSQLTQSIGGTGAGEGNQATIDQLSQLNAAQTTSLASQDGKGNVLFLTQRDDNQSSIIHQESNYNKANVKQGTDSFVTDTSHGNHSEIDQGGIGGNTATIDQVKGLLGSSYVTQEGSNGQATVTQNDNGTLGGGNTVTVSQFADSNIAIVTQTGFNNSSTVTENKDGNDARVTQTGHDNTSTVSQSAATGSAGAQITLLGIQSLPASAANFTSFAGVLQVGNGLESHITATGASDFAWVNQSGLNPTGMKDVSTVTQSGLFDAAFVQQVGTNFGSTLTQSGNNDFAGVDQKGSGNTSTWTQSGNSNNYNSGQPVPYSGFTNAVNGVHQSGTGQTSTITQLGNNGLVNVIQSNSGNTSLINQGGTSNNGLITQSGQSNDSELDQITGSVNNTATVLQGSNNNFSGVTQFGTNSIATVTQGGGV